jgi:hypothetical protein
VLSRARLQELQRVQDLLHGGLWPIPPVEG